MNHSGERVCVEGVELLFGVHTLTEDAQLVIRSDLNKLELMDFRVKNDRLVAGVWEVNEDVQAEIRRAAPIDSKKPADVGQPSEL